MSIVEFIGFIITMGAMVLLFFKRVKEERHRLTHPDEMEEEGLPSDDPIKQFLRTLDGDDEEEEERKPKKVIRPPTPPVPMQMNQKKSAKKKALSNEFQFQSKLEKHRLNPNLAGFLPETSIDSRKLGSTLDDRYIESLYEVHKKESSSYGEKVINRLHSRREMMICHEILSRPKGLEG